MRGKVDGKIMLMLGVLVLFFLSWLLFNRNQYQAVSLGLATAACLPFYYRYEKKQLNIKELVLIAVLTTTAVSGRVVFYLIPAVTPMTALIILTGICMGAEVGFLVGSLSAVTSNILFGQGPWTPFQMFSWGVIGLLAGLPFVRHQLQKHYWLLSAYGIFAGLFFSFFMDVWTVFSLDHAFSWPRYAALLVTAAPFTLTYCAANVFFSCLLLRTFQSRLQRILIKYNIRAEMERKK
ncbi:ECF transporter S component [Enterococcus sp. UD-01]|jgi:energy-coupling factor transport system substrate-specific component|uniref:ECF transporter S component n=1 Tax=Enterococcus sp. UD-01 TaxID=3373911 RepID=UPI00383476D5